MIESIIVISLLTKLSVDRVISEIFNLGFGVIPVSTGPNHLIATDDSPAAVLVLKITSPPMEINVLLTKIGQALTDNKIKYYSVVLMSANVLSWLGSNFSLKDVKEKKLKINHPYLKLIKKDSKEDPKSSA